jgi:site-specific DNA-cytosine methylase
MKSKVCVSCFDGISGLQLALKRSSIKINKYYASEIDEKSIQITQNRFPKTIQLGDIRSITKDSIAEQVWLLSAGSPCQDLSIMGKQIGMTTKRGKRITSLDQYLKLKESGAQFFGQSYLFWEFIRLYRELKPKYFFFENVKMSGTWQYIISRELGVLPMKINSSLVSAQNRERYYWTNIPDVSMPEDKHIKLSDVIPGAIAGHGIRGRKNNLTGKYDRHATTRKDCKANCLVTRISNTGKVTMKNGTVRNLTVNEAEMLQNLPKNYTKVPGVSENDRFKGIGNGWTINVIAHLIKPLKKNLEVSKN